MAHYLKQNACLVIALLGCLAAPIKVVAQIPVPLGAGAADITVTLATFFIGDPTYTASLDPQSITGAVTWEVIDAGALGDPGPGLQMMLNGAVFTSGNVVIAAPNGTAEDITFSLSGTPPVEGDYTVELEVFDGNGPTVEVNFTIPVRRRPVSVVFVLDRSGSMGSPPHGGSGTITRMDILKTAASLFVNKLNAFNQTGDEAALTYFESTVDNPVPAFGNALTAVSGNANNFITDINAQVDGSATAMGDGLLAGKTKLASAAAGNRQFMFLFTDGEQNMGNLVNAAGTMAGATSLNNAGNTIQIVTIGTGAAAEMASAALLQSIANSNTGGGTARSFLLQEEVAPAGSGADFNTATGAADFFDSGFESMLSGSSPQTVDIGKGVMSPGATASKDFIINANIHRILFELITPDQRPNFTILKDGVPVTRENASLEFINGPNNGMNSLLAVINLPKTGSALISKGTWTINVQTFTQGQKPYQIKAQVDDHRLKYKFEVEAPSFKVADTLRFDAKLTYAGKPITNANFTALVLKPGDDLGDLLARAKISLAQPTYHGTDMGSVGYQKLLAAIANNPELIDALKLQENLVTLTHTGNGNFSGQFPNTNVSGVYRIIGRISGGNDTIGTCNRLFNRSVYIRFGNPVAEISTQRFAISKDKDFRIQLLYTPMYMVGNVTRFVGPGFGGGMEVVGADVGNVTVRDNGDGSYVIDISVLNGNVDPDLKISLAGVAVYEGKASKFGGSTGLWDKLTDWWKTTLHLPLWLLYLLLLALLIWILWLIIRALRT